MTTVESAPFSVGSLVRVRDREWVVLPGSDAELLLVRPLGGTDAEQVGAYFDALRRHAAFDALQQVQHRQQS